VRASGQREYAASPVRTSADCDGRPASGMDVIDSIKVGDKMTSIDIAAS